MASNSPRSGAACCASLAICIKQGEIPNNGKRFCQPAGVACYATTKKFLRKLPYAVRSVVFATILIVLSTAAATSSAQEVIDRIAARVENDIILLSDIQALSQYQLLVDGKSESDAQILDRLIDQWIVRTEADTAQFPHPADAEINTVLERLRKSFSSPEEYESRKKQSGLSDEEIHSMMASQLYLSNYLESRFRPSVQVSQKQIEDFYQNILIPRAKARGQEPPSPDSARDAIQEALVQQGINEEADRWLKESRSRLNVEMLLDKGGK